MSMDDGGISRIGGLKSTLLSSRSVDAGNGAGAGTPAPSAPPRMRIESVERTFVDGKRQVKALGPISLDVAEGQFLSIVGPSGCGKSTLLRIIAGLANPSVGEIGIEHIDPKRPLIAMVFQDHSIYPWKTVEANVRLGLDLDRRLPRARRAEIVRGYLDRLGLIDFAKAYPDTLSGGMRQRVAIARALAVEPEILLMDEPFAALDAQMRTLLQDDLVDLWESDQRTVIFITHSIEEAIFLSDRVVVMSARPGRICLDQEVPFGRPRDHAIRGSAEFAALHLQIWDVLRDEVGRGLQPLERAVESKGQPDDDS